MKKEKMKEQRLLIEKALTKGGNGEAYREYEKRLVNSSSVIFTNDMLSISVSSPKVKILKVEYNPAKGTTFVDFGDRKIVVKRSEDAEHNPYNALTAAIAQYVLGNQTAVSKAVEMTTELKVKK